MSVDTNDLEQIAQMVWESFLDMAVIAGGPVEADAVSEGAQVSISGAWDGRVRLECSEILARRLTSQLLVMPEEELDQETIDDALRELVNIIGGNIKALLPEPSRLGIPEPLSPRGPGMLALALDCDSEPLVIGIQIVDASAAWE